jgi:hypothetical protein
MRTSESARARVVLLLVGAALAVGGDALLAGAGGGAGDG